MINLNEIAKKIDVPERQADMGFVYAFEINPDIAYPAVIRHILKVLTNEEKVGPSFRQLKTTASSIPVKTWEYLLKQSATKSATLNENEKANRYQALEITRLWLTELLHQSVAQKSMYIHIVASDTWKLN